MKNELKSMQEEIKKLAQVIVDMATTDVRLTAVEQDVRELRHGQGFIQRSLDGEYNKTGKL